MESGLEYLSTVKFHCLSMAAALLISSPCRLHAAKDKAEARRRAALYAADHPIDPATGRPFFHPQTGRAPEARNKQGMPVGDWLYTKWWAAVWICAMSRMP